MDLPVTLLTNFVVGRFLEDIVRCVGGGYVTEGSKLKAPEISRPDRHVFAPPFPHCQANRFLSDSPCLSTSSQVLDTQRQEF